ELGGERQRMLQELSRTCQQLQQQFEHDVDHNVLIVGGDMNGHIGMNGDDAVDAEGHELRDFADEHDLMFANTWVGARGALTWRGADRTARSARGTGAANTTGSTIDYALVSAAHYACISGFDICEDDLGIASDHKPIVLELTLTQPATDADAGDEPA